MVPKYTGYLPRKSQTKILCFEWLLYTSNSVLKILQQQMLNVIVWKKSFYGHKLTYGNHFKNAMLAEEILFQKNTYGGSRVSTVSLLVHIMEKMVFHALLGVGFE